MGKSFALLEAAMQYNRFSVSGSWLKATTYRSFLVADRLYRPLLQPGSQKLVGLFL